MAKKSFEFKSFYDNIHRQSSNTNICRLYSVFLDLNVVNKNLGFYASRYREQKTKKQITLQ